LVNEDDWTRFQTKTDTIARCSQFLRDHKHDGDTLEKWLKRTETTWDQLIAWNSGLAEFAPDVVEQVTLEAKYAGYIDRQAAQIEKFHRLESKTIPAHFDYGAVPQLRVEAQEKLSKIRPANLGQASRISGITPADLAVVLFYLD
jgi:tRNA uridine 5-carboxymethylaminomethyl modification enzyme